MHVPALTISRISSTDSEMPISRTKFINTRRHEKARLVTSCIHGTFPLKCVVPFPPSVPWGNNLDLVCILPLILHSSLCAARFLPKFVFPFICCQTPPPCLQAALWCAGSSTCREVLEEQSRGAVGEPIKHAPAANRCVSLPGEQTLPLAQTLFFQPGTNLLSYKQK